MKPVTVYELTGDLTAVTLDPADVLQRVRSYARTTRDPALEKAADSVGDRLHKIRPDQPGITIQTERHRITITVRQNGLQQKNRTL